MDSRGTAENSDKMRESWERANGAGNQGRTAVLPAGWDWQQISLTPEQAQYIAIMQMERTEICGVMYSTPPHLVGDTSRLSNSNHESQMQEFQKITLMPLIVNVEGEINRKIMPRIGRNASRYEARFDATELVRGDFDALMTAIAVGRQWGTHSANDARQTLGMDPIPGVAGNTYLVPLNMVDASRINEEPAPAAAAQNANEPADPKLGDGKTPQGNGGQNQRAAGPNQQRLLDRMADAYRPLFRDATGRLTARDKRDAAAVGQIFGPVLAAIAEESVRQARQVFRLPEDAELDTEKLLRETARQLEKRSAHWSATSADAEADKTLDYAVRAIALHVFREAGSTVAQAS